MEDEYRRLLLSLAQDFPRFVRQLRNHRGEKANLGKACVVEFQEEQPSNVTPFDSPEQLHSHLLIPKALRRLWLLEDVSLNWITVLGAHLRIPPRFFASHWADPSGVDFNHRPIFSQNPERCFLLKYPRFQRAMVHGVKGDSRDPVLAVKCNVERYFFFSSPEDTTYENPDFARSYHNLSFWSRKISDQHWDGRPSFRSGTRIAD